MKSNKTYLFWDSSNQGTYIKPKPKVNKESVENRCCPIPSIEWTPCNSKIK